VHVSFRTGDWDFLIGINKVFWGVAETRHLVNIVNRLDIVEDTDEEGIFWLSMVAVGLEKDWGTTGLFRFTWLSRARFSGLARPPACTTIRR